MIQVECPNCGHIFQADIDENGLFECSNCDLLLSVDFNDEVALTFEECVLESSLVYMDLSNIDNESLEDEVCSEVALGPGHYMKGTFDGFVEMEKLGTLSPSSRKLLEGVYILMNTHKVFGVEQ